MNRREFLLLRNEQENTLELSCEQLYMRYLDSTLDGSTDEFFKNVEETLTSVRLLHVSHASWLNCDELQPFKSILARFRNRGGELSPRTLVEEL